MQSTCSQPQGHRTILNWQHSILQSFLHNILRSPTILMVGRTGLHNILHTILHTRDLVQLPFCTTSCTYPSCTASDHHQNAKVKRETRTRNEKQIATNAKVKRETRNMKRETRNANTQRETLTQQAKVRRETHNNSIASQPLNCDMRFWNTHNEKQIATNVKVKRETRNARHETWNAKRETRNTTQQMPKWDREMP